MSERRADPIVIAQLRFAVGAQHRKGLLAEWKVGLLDSPNVKFGVGYAFGK